jgi:hypothetical protein
LAKRRDIQIDHAQAVIQILAEAIVLHLVLKAPVRGRNEPHIHGAGACLSHPSHLALLEDAQQADLHRGRHVADLVQKERAAVRGLKQARAVVHGAGEGAPHVSEQFTFEQRIGESAAIHGDKGTAGPPRGLVQPTGEPPCPHRSPQK